MALHNPHLGPVDLEARVLWLVPFRFLGVGDGIDPPSDKIYIYISEPSEKRIATAMLLNVGLRVQYRRH